MIVRNLRPEIADQLALALGIMEKDLLLAAPLDFRILPGEHAKYHRVLEPFALVDGDQPDRVFIAFQAQLMFLGGFLLRIHLLGQPLEQPAEAEAPFGFSLVQHLAQVKHIGKPPFPVRKGQKPLAHSFTLQPLPEHAEEAAAVPQVEVFVEPLQPFLPLAFGAGRKLSAIHAEKIGGQRCLHQALVARQRHARQDAAELERFRGLKQAGRGMEDARDIQIAQSFLHFAGLLVLHDQHRNVLRFQAPLPDLGVAVEQPGDLAGHDPGQGLLGQASGDVLAVALPEPETKRRLGSAIEGERSLIGLPLGIASWKSMRSKTKAWGAALKILLTATTSPVSERQFSPKVKRRVASLAASR